MKHRGRHKKYILRAAVLLCVLAVQCCFAFQKEGYHMDEMISFEMSNAEYNPWIVPTQPVGRLAKFVQEELRGETFIQTFANLADTVQDAVKNRGGSKILQYKADVYPEPVWIDSKGFTDYVTANGKGRFNYLSVYFNEKDDVHPPLYSMLLHTMSSLFPGVIVPFLGCFINILAILGCVLLIFRLGEVLESGGILPEGSGELWGVCAALLYGISSGAIATALLIRMYGLMTFFCVALFYAHLKKWMGNGFGRKNKGLAAVTMLGFWTQYFFLFYCLALAAVTAGLLAAKKRYKELRGYVIAMASAGVIGVAVFPFSIKAVLSSDRGQEAAQYLGQGLAGYGTRLAAFGKLLLEGTFGNAALGGCILLCLLAGGILWRLRRRKGGHSVFKGQVPAFLLLLLVPLGCDFLLTSRMAPYLVDRYIMPLFPFVVMFVVYLLIKLFCADGEEADFPEGSPAKRDVLDGSPAKGGVPDGDSAKGRSPQSGRAVRARRYLVPVIVLALAVFQAAAYDGRYLYKGYSEQLAVAEQYQDLPCVCLYEGVGFYTNLVEFTYYDRTLLTRLEEMEQRQDREELLGLEQLVVLRKSNVDEEGMQRVLELYGWKVEEILLEAGESVHGDTVYLCGKSE